MVVEKIEQPKKDKKFNRIQHIDFIKSQIDSAISKMPKKDLKSLLPVEYIKTNLTEIQKKNIINLVRLQRLKSQNKIPDLDQ